MFEGIGKAQRRRPATSDFLVTVEYRREGVSGPAGVVMTQDHHVTTKPQLRNEVLAQCHLLKLAEEEANANFDVVGKQIARA